MAEPALRVFIIAVTALRLTVCIQTTGLRACEKQGSSGLCVLSFVCFQLVTRGSTLCACLDFYSAKWCSVYFLVSTVTSNTSNTAVTLACRRHMPRVVLVRVCINDFCHLVLISVVQSCLHCFSSRVHADPLPHKRFLEQTRKSGTAPPQW